MGDNNTNHVHEVCKQHGHSWDQWVAYEGLVVEMGLTDGFRYRRTCSLLGCNAEERTENLVPQGRTEIREKPENTV